MPSVTQSKAGYPCLVCFAGDAVLVALRPGGVAGLEELVGWLEFQRRHGVLFPCAARQWNGKAIAVSLPSVTPASFTPSGLPV